MKPIREFWKDSNFLTKAYFLIGLIGKIDSSPDKMKYQENAKNTNLTVLENQVLLQFNNQAAYPVIFVNCDLPPTEIPVNFV